MEIETKFERMGARARTSVAGADARRAVSVDVQSDRRGEYFDVVARKGVEFEVIDLDRRERHLLLLARVDGEKSRYLCGHDERHWFVAAIPERTPVSTVEDAKLALRPEVPTRFRSTARKRLLARRSVEHVRQGEWFFVPAPDFRPGPRNPIRRHEPLSRGVGSKPHVAEEAVRSGGTVLWFPQFAGWRRRVSPRHALGYSQKEMEQLAVAHPKWRWISMLRDPEVHVRGAIRHPDHATVSLRGWHRVYMNTEPLARAAENVMFLD